MGEITADETNLQARCKAILLERAKQGREPVDSVLMGRLLGVGSSECFRAMHAIPGVVADKSQKLVTFSLGNT